ncbi:MAG TPA: trypsin-like peptidase domain-containing protein [Spirochaetota bacterium]|nr:trypsin-like peptidase domain-containing protein [Spirochaetota bacterium]
MKQIRTSLFLFILFVSAGAALPAGVPDFSFAAARAKPSVVYISVFDHEDGDKRKGLLKTGYGTGSVISRDGYILTNYHVVNKGSFYQVIFYDGAEREVERFSNGEYYIADDETDLAILKLREPETYDLTPISFGDSDKLVEGQWVIAIGSPYGLRNSVTCGIVSSLGRSDVGFTEIEDFIQTDVPINPGNSGGPLLNERGELIGINSAIRTVSGGFQGISFAIPSQLAEKVYRELITYGRVRRGWLGILVKETRRAGSESKDIRVISVTKDSPAAAAGLREGDLVRQADGSPALSRGKLMRLVKGKEVGSILKLVISRDGKLKEVSIPLREKESFRKLSRALSRLYDKYGIELSEERSGGIVVAELSPQKIATHGSALRVGDVIVSINGAKIVAMDDFARVFARWDYVISKATVLRGDRLYVIDFNSDREND